MGLLHARWDWLEQQGLEALRLSADEVRRVEPRITPEVVGGLYLEELGMVESYKILLALAEAAMWRGASIRHGNLVSIEWERDRAVGGGVGA